jgi:hypothetical protein
MDMVGFYILHGDLAFAAINEIRPSRIYLLQSGLGSMWKYAATGLHVEQTLHMISYPAS